jgi:hypothetical protein
VSAEKPVAGLISILLPRHLESICRIEPAAAADRTNRGERRLHMLKCYCAKA